MYGPTCSFSRAILLSDSSETAFRAHFGQLAFVHVGMHLVQRFRGDQFEHRITEEFEAFVVLGPLMLV